MTVKNLNIMFGTPSRYWKKTYDGYTVFADSTSIDFSDNYNDGLTLDTQIIKLKEDGNYFYAYDKDDGFYVINTKRGWYTHYDDMEELIDCLEDLPDGALEIFKELKRGYKTYNKKKIKPRVVSMEDL